jgi:lysophospholipase L1-like esterase
VSVRLTAFLIANLLLGCGGTAGNETSTTSDVQCVRASEGFAPSAWEFAIEDYEAADADDPPARGSIVFVGSSSILLWSTLNEDMAPLPVLNRGFGGSEIAHVTYFADRIVLPYEPSAIVLYAGDNDIGFGSSAGCALNDFEAFFEHIRAAAPDTPIYFISIKPSLARWELWDEMRRANQLIEARTRTDRALHFIDVSQAMLDEQAQPRDELFLEDGLHMTPAGYQLWTSIVRPRLEADLGF